MRHSINRWSPYICLLVESIHIEACNCVCECAKLTHSIHTVCVQRRRCMKYVYWCACARSMRIQQYTSTSMSNGNVLAADPFNATSMQHTGNCRAFYNTYQQLVKHPAGYALYRNTIKHTHTPVHEYEYTTLARKHEKAHIESLRRWRPSI